MKLCYTLIYIYIYIYIGISSMHTCCSQSIWVKLLFSSVIVFLYKTQNILDESVTKYNSLCLQENGHLITCYDLVLGQLHNKSLIVSCHHIYNILKCVNMDCQIVVMYKLRYPGALLSLVFLLDFHT